jgi:hypothetical protein
MSTKQEKRASLFRVVVLPATLEAAKAIARGPTEDAACASPVVRDE